MNQDKEDKDRINDHIEYHIVHEDDSVHEQGQGQGQGQRQEEPSIALYALIKYVSLIIIVLAILYFIAVYILPLVRDSLR